MGLHQIQMRYDAEQDRILLRLSTREGSEFRFWLTRRFVKRLWGMLLKMLEWDRPVAQQVDPQTRRTVLDIRHGGFVQQGDFSKPFETAPRTLPLGEAPVLAAKAAGKRTGDGNHILSLHPQQGEGIDLKLDTRLLHLFVKLLRDAVGRADWEIALALHGGESGGGSVEAGAQAFRLN